jgi:hypothetical protein
MSGGRTNYGKSLGGPEIPLGVPTRPQSAEEQEQLLRVVRSSKVKVLRGLGILLSIGALMLALTWFLGVPYDPDTFLVEAPILGILGVGLAGGAAGIVRGPRAAIGRGETLDITGVVLPFPARLKGLAAVTVGPIGIAFPPNAAKLLSAGLRHRIVLALETRKLGLPDLGLATGAVILSVDDVKLSSPRRAFVAPVGAGYAAPAYPAPMAPTTPGYPMPTPPPAPVAPPTSAPGAVGAHVFCPRCGYENAADSRFCPRCGNNVPVIVSQRPAPA